MKTDEPTSEQLDYARRVLETMLGYLGFIVQVEIDENEAGRGLQVFTEESEALIGPGGERLEDLQYLVNRLLRARDAAAPRLRVDVQHHRAMQEDDFLRGIQEMADHVRRTGRPVKLQPLNSYYRRLVHQAFKDDPVVASWSPPDSGRVKRISLIRRRGRHRAEGDGPGESSH